MLEEYPFYQQIFLVLVAVIGNIFSVGFFILPIFIYRKNKLRNKMLIKKFEEEDKR